MIYLDYAATTPLHEDVRAKHQDLLSDYFANADSLYKIGVDINRLVEKSRQLIAQLLHVKETEVIFTSGASEANTMAIKGCAFQYQNRGKHIITSAVEHSSVYQTCIQLRDVFGFDVDFLAVDEHGCLDLNELQRYMRKETILVSVMHVNNEVGIINPINDIRKIIQEINPMTKFHVDMVQSLGKIDIDLSQVDMASFSAHKIYGLKGSGILVKKESTVLLPLICGGQQERGLRGGTVNAATHIMFAKTLRLALDNQKQASLHVRALNQWVRKALLKAPEIVIITPEKASTPYILNFSCVGYKAEVLLHALEEDDIYVSTKSTCSSQKKEISRTLKAMQIPEDIAQSAMRISFSHLTTQEDVEQFIICLFSILKKIKKQR